MYIPYNGNKLMQPKTEKEVLGKPFVNPDYSRWELHRVWVGEANLRAGQRHTSAKSRYYVDEDAWQAVLADRWDARGQLWRTLSTTNMVAPEVPGTISLGLVVADLSANQGWW